ncbi:glycosyltransferase [Microbacterium marinilacus]|uniref:D-inositol 3-phosphate glycosyltransferase n=1 Tax=Microbacterium marinilacus TaxID=415209 RepID=A0ABP7BQX1_9MICO|nr:glycosyltransferase [Microbacterium marinilacus]MBY0690054.1 glycosyltransferase [Microbacterium marinilacus]
MLVRAAAERSDEAPASERLPRVVVIDHTGRESGAELALLRVVERLHGTRADVRALLFSAGPFADRLRTAGVPTAVLPLDPAVNETARERLLSPLALARSLARTAAFVPRVARALRRADAEVVVANSLKAAVITALAAPLAGRRWVWHLHDRLARDYLPAPVVVALQALAAVGPRAVVVNSRATLRTLPARARRRASVAYPGLAPEAFAPAPKPDGPPVVGIIGRISPTKGQREFLEAAAAVRRTHPATRFRVVGAAVFGEDDYEAGLHVLAERLGIGDRVEFTGWAADPGRHLRELTLLVHASPVPEPFGQVVAEAAAAGVPVVATVAGGVPEILDPEASGEPSPAPAVRATAYGVLVRPGDADALADAVRLALDDAPARAARAEAARAMAARFAIEHTADAVWRVWSS